MISVSIQSVVSTIICSTSSRPVISDGDSSSSLSVGKSSFDWAPKRHERLSQIKTPDQNAALDISIAPDTLPVPRDSASNELHRSRRGCYVHIAVSSCITRDFDCRHHTTTTEVKKNARYRTYNSSKVPNPKFYDMPIIRHVRIRVLTRSMTSNELNRLRSG